MAPGSVKVSCAVSRQACCMGANIFLVLGATHRFFRPRAIVAHSSSLPPSILFLLPFISGFDDRSGGQVGSPKPKRPDSRISPPPPPFPHFLFLSVFSEFFPRPSVRPSVQGPPFRSDRPFSFRVFRFSPGGFFHSSDRNLETIKASWMDRWTDCQLWGGGTKKEERGKGGKRARPAPTIPTNVSWKEGKVHLFSFEDRGDFFPLLLQREELFTIPHSPPRRNLRSRETGCQTLEALKEEEEDESMSRASSKEFVVCVVACLLSSSRRSHPVPIARARVLCVCRLLREKLKPSSSSSSAKRKKEEGRRGRENAWKRGKEGRKF